MNRSPHFVLFLILLVGCSNVVREISNDEPLVVIPAHFDPIAIPADNPLTKEKVSLGRLLFYDTRLSLDGTVSCGTCHRQEAAFSDAPKTLSVGVHTARTSRNSPSIINAAYVTPLLWDGRAKSLEEQHMFAILTGDEMEADTGRMFEVLRISGYREKWMDAYGDTTITLRRIVNAIACFVRTIVSADSRYDRFLAGDKLALSASEQRGMNLFFSKRLACSECHSGPLFTDNRFHNIGLFFYYLDLGRMGVTGKAEDHSVFKTPSLRNVELTPPYMTTGENEESQLTTLESVIEHYERGGFIWATKDPRIKPLNLTPNEKQDLVEFLRSLTDSSVIQNPRFSHPSVHGIPR